MTTPHNSREAELSAIALSASIGQSLKHGNYDLELLEAARRLNATLAMRADAPRTEDNREYLKMKCRISEVFDYFGRFREARQVLGDGQQILDKLRRRRKTAVPITRLSTQKLAREEVRFCLEYAQTFYRSHDYKAAKEIITQCQTVVTKHLADEADFPCYGTRARTMYYLGRVHRQMNDYDQAESCFIEAIHYHHLRATRKLKEYGDNADADAIREELDFARHKSAICLAMGLGWVSYTKGALLKAKSYIMPARVLLLSTRDIVNTAYLHLILGAIERSLAGRDPEKLGRATELLKQSYRVFKNVGHLSYEARASFELSLAYLYAGDTSGAERERQRVERISQERDDVRWRCNAWILGSRIKRAEGNAAGAEDLATEAFNLAESKNQSLCKIDALIARSEAWILLKCLDKARSDLKEALKINAGRHPNAQGRSAETANHKVEAVCNLYLARTHILEKDTRQAEGYIERWKQLQEQVEHVSVRDLGDKTRQAFSRLRAPFHIAPSSPSLNYKEHRDDLFAWLRREAKHRTPQKGKQDELLGISREARRKKRKPQESNKA